MMKKHRGIVRLTNMDKRIVPLYQVEVDGIHAKCADLLFGIGEVVGAGERHEKRTEVEKALQEHKFDTKGYERYLEMKEKYPMKTSGSGMGTERYMLWLLKHDDIRDCQLLPRFHDSIIIP